MSALHRIGPALRPSTSRLHRLLSSSSAPYPSPSPSPSPTPASTPPLRTPLPANPASHPDPVPLLDSFSRPHTYLRLSLTERCNLRCQYCMPAEGIPLTPAPHLLTLPELLRLSGIFLRRSISKIRLTGGEPLLRPDLPSLVSQLRALRPANPPSISLTTNGILLPRFIPALVDAGLSSVNVSLDTLVAAKFELIARRKGHGKVLAAIRQAVDAGISHVKVNVVVMRGVNDDEVISFARMTEDMPLDIRFIEYMPFDGNRWNASKFVSYADMLAALAAEFGALERLTDTKHSTTKHYRIPGFAGRVGFITSMSNHFCAGCNRLRITADGNLKVCLFGAEELSLRDAIRAGASDDELEAVIEHALQGKHWKLGGRQDMHDIAGSPNRSMIRIGG